MKGSERFWLEIKILGPRQLKDEMILTDAFENVTTNFILQFTITLRERAIPDVTRHVVLASEHIEDVLAEIRFGDTIVTNF